MRKPIFSRCVGVEDWSLTCYAYSIFPPPTFMTKIEVQCLLIDREHKPAFGDVFSVEVHSNATIEKLRDAIKESTVRRPTIQHMDIDAVMLTVWRCSDPKLLSTMNRTRLGKKLHDIDLTDETKVKELAAGAAIKDLHLSDGELLLVQLPGAFPRQCELLIYIHCSRCLQNLLRRCP